MEHCTGLEARGPAFGDQPPGQILVFVANSETKNLNAEMGKGPTHSLLARWWVFLKPSDNLLGTCKMVRGL